MQDGTIKCCGRNNYGQLGLGHTNSPVSTVMDLPFTGVKNIVGGLYYTFFIMQDGSVKCCGNNNQGQLGLGHTNNPVSTVTDLPLTGVKNIVCGNSHTFFIMQDGSIKVCGDNTNGQLGLGNTNTPVSTVTDLPLTGVKNIVCGNSHTFFIMRDGTVKACGDNQYGQLGLGFTTSSPYAYPTVTNLPLTGVKNIVCGRFHTFFIMRDGTIKCCGHNQYGQLGLGFTTSSPYAYPTVTNLPLTGVKDIVCGGNHTFFIMKDGTIKCCGHNQYGQLGLGFTTSSPYAHPTVTDLPFTGVKNIACGQSHTFFIMQDGTIKVCGYNSDGQLGLGHRTDVSTVTNLPFTGVKDFADISSLSRTIINILLKYLNKNYTLNNGEMIELSDELTKELFDKYGMNDLYNIYNDCDKIITQMEFDRGDENGTIYKKVLNPAEFKTLSIE